MSHGLAVLLLLAILLGVYALMYTGWSRRRGRHPAAASTQAAPAGSAVAGSEAAGADVVSAEGVYISTVSEQSRHDRVTAAGLGARARSSMVVGGSGVQWDREGADSVHVDSLRVIGAGLSAGMAGKFVGRPRVLAVSWRADDGSAYVTGFLPRYRADTQLLLGALERLVARRSASPAPADDNVPIAPRENP